MIVTNLSPKEFAQYRAERKKEERQTKALLNSLGYSSKTVPADLWKLFNQCASRQLFLNEPNLYQVDGKATERLLLHKLRFDNAGLSERFIAVMASKHPEFKLHAHRQPVECLEDREVEFTHRVLMTAAAVTRVACQVLDLAHIFLATDYLWRPISEEQLAATAPPLNFQSWPARPRRVMRFRTESYADLLLTRSLLAPCVCRWTDSEARSYDTKGVETATTTLSGHEVEFELADDRHTLDELRWLLNEVTDLHVAAQSLNYADQYTGERLNYEYLERMAPTGDRLLEVRKTLACMKPLKSYYDERLEEVLDNFDVDELIENDDLEEELDEVTE